MSFSPRARPRVVNLALTDPDLTDTYQDLTRSTESSLGLGRHPRGDTPLSVAPQRRSSLTGTSNNSNTATSRTRTGGYGTALSNLDKLLDFLDDEDRETTPPPSPPPATTTLRSSGVPPSTARRLDSSQDSPDSPSPRPGSVAAMRSGDKSFIQQQGGGGISFTTTTAQRLQQEVQAELEVLDMNGHARLGDVGDQGSVDSITRVAQAALDEFDDIVSSRNGSTTTAALLSNRSTSRASRLRNIPSPTLSAPRPHSSNTEQEPTKARSSAGEGSLRRNGANGFDSRASFSSSAHSHRRAPPSVIHNEHRYDDRTPYSEELGMDPHELNLQLINELREAQDYISFLQAELQTIGRVVHKLRDHEQDEQEEEANANELPRIRQRCPVSPERVVRSSSSSAPERTESKKNERNSIVEHENVLQATNQQAFEIVKHLLNMIPTLGSSSFPPTSKATSTSIASIVSSLEFVRKTDALLLPLEGANGGDSGTGMKRGKSVRRRDEEVFEKENLERLERELERRVLMLQ